jgi:hypothetical protein
MKRFLVFILLLTTSCLFADNNDILKLRELFYSASKDSKAAEIFYEKLKPVTTSSDPLLIGYKGMSELLLCYHSYNPYTKLSHFGKGKELLDKAISLNPENTELHYLRYSVQTNVPLFLGYRSNIQNDKKLILIFLFDSKNKKNDADLFDRVYTYMLNSNECSEEEKKQLIQYKYAN